MKPSKQFDDGFVHCLDYVRIERDVLAKWLEKYGQGVCDRYIKRCNQYLADNPRFRNFSHTTLIASWMRTDNIKPLSDNQSITLDIPR